MTSYRNIPQIRSQKTSPNLVSEWYFYGGPLVLGLMLLEEYFCTSVGLWEHEKWVKDGDLIRQHKQIQLNLTLIYCQTSLTIVNLCSFFFPLKTKVLYEHSSLLNNLTLEFTLIIVKFWGLEICKTGLTLEESLRGCECQICWYCFIDTWSYVSLRCVKCEV
jgi:hypothetical protein